MIIALCRISFRVVKMLLYQSAFNSIGPNFFSVVYINDYQVTGYIQVSVNGKLNLR